MKNFANIRHEICKTILSNLDRTFLLLMAFFAIQLPSKLQGDGFFV